MSAIPDDVEKRSGILDINKDTPLDLSVLCQPIPEIPDDWFLTLPGGLKIHAQGGIIPIGGLEYARLAIGAASNAIAPLGPIFDIIEMIASIQKAFSAVLDALGPPPDPSKLVKVVKDLEEKTANLVKLLPIFSLPIMLVQFLDILIQALEGSASEFISLARFGQQIQEAQFAAEQSPGLGSIIKCAVSSQQTQFNNVERAIASINPIIDVFNLFAKLAQINKQIPQLGADIPPEPLPAALALRRAADQLRELRALIPI